MADEYQNIAGTCCLNLEGKSTTSSYLMIEVVGFSPKCCNLSTREHGALYQMTIKLTIKTNYFFVTHPHYPIISCLLH
jgi:hypothetical protein